MEKSILIMIVIVAIVAIGGLIYIGLEAAPNIIPVFVKSAEVSSGPLQDTAFAEGKGTMRFNVAPPSAVAKGKFTFSVKE